MKQFMMLMYGFEPPSPEIMQAWNAWFDEIKDRMVSRGHFPQGYEYSKDGEQALPMTAESITGYVLLKAQDLEEAKRFASTNPYISAIRVYEVMGG